jgi:hypothetical protein
MPTQQFPPFLCEHCGQAISFECPRCKTQVVRIADNLVLHDVNDPSEVPQVALGQTGRKVPCFEISGFSGQYMGRPQRCDDQVACQARSVATTNILVRTDQPVPAIGSTPIPRVA